MELHIFPFQFNQKWWLFLNVLLIDHCAFMNFQQIWPLENPLHPHVNSVNSLTYVFLWDLHLYNDLKYFLYPLQISFMHHYFEGSNIHIGMLLAIKRNNYCGTRFKLFKCTETCVSFMIITFSISKLSYYQNPSTSRKK